MPVKIVRADITKMKTDAIVNAANTYLRPGGGVCGAIFQAAGYRDLEKACLPLAPIETGQAALTPGFALDAKYVIHAAGPIYDAEQAGKCADQLYSAYAQSLKLADKHKCRSISFPLISSGIYGYPKAQALSVAMQSFRDFLTDHEMDIYLCVFDESAFQISKKLSDEIESYIDQNYVDEHLIARHHQKGVFSSAGMADAAIDVCSAPMSFDDLFSHMEDTFSQYLLSLIDRKGKSDVEVYKKANLDRRLFSKIRSSKDYCPKKQTVLALAIGLELNLSETEDLLEKAGYALSHSSRFDVVVEYFIVNGLYDVLQIDQVLFHYHLPLLSGK